MRGCRWSSLVVRQEIFGSVEEQCPSKICSTTVLCCRPPFLLQASAFHFSCAQVFNTMNSLCHLNSVLANTCFAVQVPLISHSPSGSALTTSCHCFPLHLHGVDYTPCHHHSPFLSPSTWLSVYPISPTPLSPASPLSPPSRTMEMMYSGPQIPPVTEAPSKSAHATVHCSPVSCPACRQRRGGQQPRGSA